MNLQQSCALEIFCGEMLFGGITAGAPRVRVWGRKERRDLEHISPVEPDALGTSQSVMLAVSRVLCWAQGLC